MLLCCDFTITNDEVVKEELSGAKIHNHFLNIFKMRPLILNELILLYFLVLVFFTEKIKK